MMIVSKKRKRMRMRNENKINNKTKWRAGFFSAATARGGDDQ